MQSTRKFRGKLMISNPKGKIVGRVPKNAINNMDITLGAYGLDIRIYVVMNFGTSIGTITNSLIEDIHNRVKDLTGLEPNSVAIIVTGMISKQQLSRRNIEVKR
jgi:uncharacterized alkaline shock family protein YloU